MYNEEDFIQLSALQHFMFCPRQCALIHIEQVWVENRFTAEGRIMHENVHSEDIEMRSGVRIERGVPLCSKRLGLSAKADVVEFHRKAEDEIWRPFPVEYKRGKPKSDNCDRVQLCAQAMCLEEMLDVIISEGALFYGRTRRRFQVIFDEILRMETEKCAQSVHSLIAASITPKPKRSKKCVSCSLVSVCMPKVFGRTFAVEKYLEEILKEDEETA